MTDSVDVSSSDETSSSSSSGDEAIRNKAMKVERMAVEVRMTVMQMFVQGLHHLDAMVENVWSGAVEAYNEDDIPRLIDVYECMQELGNKICGTVELLSDGQK
jgi:hypothetical protein